MLLHIDQPRFPWINGINIEFLFKTMFPRWFFVTFAGCLVRVPPEPQRSRLQSPGYCCSPLGSMWLVYLPTTICIYIYTYIYKSTIHGHGHGPSVLGFCSCLQQPIRTNSPYLINSSDNSSMRWTTVGALDSVASAMAEEMAWRLGQSLLWILFDLYGWRFWGDLPFLANLEDEANWLPFKNLGMFEKGLAGISKTLEFQLDSTIN